MKKAAEPLSKKNKIKKIEDESSPGSCGTECAAVQSAAIIINYWNNRRQRCFHIGRKHRREHCVTAKCPHEICSATANGIQGQNNREGTDIKIEVIFDSEGGTRLSANNSSSCSSVTIQTDIRGGKTLCQRAKLFFYSIHASTY